jgi:hypothetical protein
VEGESSAAVGGGSSMEVTVGLASIEINAEHFNVELTKWK